MACGHATQNQQGFEECMHAVIVNDAAEPWTSARRGSVFGWGMSKEAIVHKGQGVLQGIGSRQTSGEGVKGGGRAL